MKKTHLIFALLCIVTLCCQTDFRKPRTVESTSWKAYRNIRYGFDLKYPSDWKKAETGEGLEIHKQKTYISIRAQRGDGPTPQMQLDEYALQIGPLNYPGLEEPLRVDSVKSDAGTEGVSVVWSGRMPQPRALNGEQVAGEFRFVYFRSLLPGEVNASSIELSLFGDDTTTFNSVVASFAHNLTFVPQEQLLSEKLITINQVPRPYFHYLGKTSGYRTDFDGDGSEELLIVGIEVRPTREYETGFIKILKPTVDGYRVVFDEDPPYNSIQQTDVKVVNFSGRAGRDLFLRFWDYRNERGKHGIYVIYHDGKAFRISTFKAFSEVLDLNKDGIDEIVVNDHSIFSESLVVSWPRIFVLKQEGFVEETIQFSDYYKNTVIPKYEELIKTTENEMYASRSIKFKNMALAAIDKIREHIDRASQISESDLN